MAARVFAASMAATMLFSAVPAVGTGFVTVQAAQQPEGELQLGENLITNTGFSENGSGWLTNGHAFSFGNEKAAVTVPVNGLGADWSPGLAQEGIALEAGCRYQISFDITATIDRDITVGFDAPRGLMQDVSLQAGVAQHVSYETEAVPQEVASNNQKLYFYLGKFHSETDYASEHSIEIANVSICKILDTTEPTEPIEPELPTVLENGTPYTSKGEMKISSVDEQTQQRNWMLQWSDEFSEDEFSDGKLAAHNVDGAGTALEGAMWSYMIGNGSGYSGAGWGNEEKEYYTDSNTSVAVGNDIDGGALVITAEKDESHAGSSYTSARLWTMDDGNLSKNKEKLYTKTYGRFESRIRVVPREGEDATGLWPAFWMMPADDVYGTWAASGEIDIMEARGSNQGEVDGTIHYGSQWPNNKAIGGHYGVKYGGENFSTADWHTYAVEWMPGELRWYVDDICYYTTREWYSTATGNADNFTYPAPFNQEFYILLNLAVGGNYDSGKLSNNLTGASMYVDYVRVYDLVGDNGAAYTPLDYENLENQVLAPVYEPSETPVVGEVGKSYVDASDLTGYKNTTNYPSESADVRNAQWYVSNLAGGTGISTNSLSKDGEDDVLCVNVTNTGANDYEVQLIHNVPVTRGYHYELSFDGKADKAKTVAAKFANISGYPAYSDGISVELESDWKHYSYDFDMVADTDADGRLEFTLGGATGRTYFKNFSIVCTGITTVAGADDAKEPLENGNHVYNGSFDQGIGRTYFWNPYPDTTLVSKKSECRGIINGTSETSGIYQKGMNLLAFDTYQVNMELSAPEATQVKVLLTDASGTKVYGQQNFAVTENAEEKSFTFTMPAEVTDKEAILSIITGTKQVQVDQVSMFRLTNQNLDWGSVDFYPMYNGDFFNGDDGWNIWSENAGWQQHSINGAGAMDMEYSVQEGADFWCVGVQSSAVKLVEGVPYKIRVNYESTKDLSVKVETPDGIQADYDFAAGTHQKEISFTASKDLSGKISMYFGNQPSNGNQHFIFSSVDVVVDTEKIVIPDTYQVKKPGSIASAGTARAGSDAFIHTNDTEWAQKISKVYVNGTEYGRDYIRVSGSNIILDKTLMLQEGAYTVKFDAAGYAQTKSIVQNIIEASDNVLLNGRFDATLESWETYFSSWNVPNGTAEAVDGEAVMHIVSTEGNNWDCQLKQAGLSLAAAKYYMLSFDAYASVERPIQMEFANMGTASQTIVNLTTEKKTYFVYFTDVKDTQEASILFMAGNVEGCLSDFEAVGSHDVVFDNISLCEATQSDVDAKTVPKVMLKEQPVLGEAVVMSYTDNAVWEEKELTISIDGKEISQKYVSIDKVQNKITIDGRLIGAVGTYSISVKAKDYDAVTVEVKVVESVKTSLLPKDWSTWLDENEKGTLTTTENGLECDFVETLKSTWQTPEFWSIQAKKEGICTIEGKTYVLSFDTNLVYTDSSVIKERGITMETNLGQQTLSVTPGLGHHSLEYTPGERKDFYVMFMLGGVETDFSTAPHHISISNITLAEKKAGAAVEKTPIEAPQNVTVSASKNAEIKMQWSKVAAAASYGIYMAPKENGAYILCGETVANTYTIKSLVPGTYYVAVAAVPKDQTAYKVSELVKKTVTIEKDKEPDTEKPDTEKPDTEKPDVEKPDTTKPDMTKPDTTKPDVEKPDSAEKPDNGGHVTGEVFPNVGGVQDGQSKIVSGIGAWRTTEDSYQTPEGRIMRRLVNGNAMITGEEKILPKGATIKTQSVVTGERYERAKEAVKAIKDCNGYKVFEIEVRNSAGANLHQLEGDVTVTMPIPEGLGNSLTNTLIVYRLEEDNTLTRCQTSVKDGNAAFQTNHFSTFIFAQQTVSTVAPQTSEEIPAQLLLLLLALVGVSAVWYRNKRRFIGERNVR